jgi:CDP-glycerol glycerophosphotransferase (TagB/SpsB family)
MMNIYYYARQVYQFSNAVPLYKEIDGTFLIKRFKRIIQFKKYFRNGNFSPDHKSLLNTPPILKRNAIDVNDLKGIMISLSNVVINNNPEQLKTIFIGHGTGDKKYGTSEKKSVSNAKKLESYDYHFVSGPKHLEKLKDSGLNIPEEKLIKIGNLRFDDYVNDKIDKERVMDRLGIKDRTRKNILYAPTWRWGDGTLLEYTPLFSKEITKEHNLIIRPHHHDRQYIKKMKLQAKINNIKHVYFSNPAAVIKSDTMHDFRVSDLLISDTSSILYEYLITGNPIIVIQNKFSDLHKMPDNLNVMKHAALYHGTENILNLINTSLKSSNLTDIYKNLLDNCFYFNDGKSVSRAAEFIHSIG